MVAISYGNKFLSANGAGTELDPAIIEVSLKVGRQATYGSVGSSFPLPVYRSPQSALPFPSGVGDREILNTEDRYCVIESLFLSSLSGEALIALEGYDITNDIYTSLGSFRVSPRVMGNPITFPIKMTPNSVIYAYTSNNLVIYGGFFIGRTVPLNN